MSAVISTKFKIQIFWPMVGEPGPRFAVRAPYVGLMRGGRMPVRLSGAALAWYV